MVSENFEQPILSITSKILKSWGGALEPPTKSNSNFAHACLYSEQISLFL